MVPPEELADVLLDVVDGAAVTETEAAAFGAVLTFVAVAVAVRVTELTDVELEATAICASFSWMEDPEATGPMLHVAVPSCLPHPNENLGVCDVGVAVSLSVTPDAVPFFVQTLTT